ncbi:S8 family serine peptidase [Streptomyces sp. NPDC090442]|uniref:S8 family serine peptidase n=1 Tax=Streptomyces sp. NPDC090442 TaxID=3365962 RepID=UPI003830E814
MADYWPVRLEHPNLPDGVSEVSIEVRPLEDFIHNFLEKGVTTWGQHAMRLHELPSEYRGKGIIVTLIDAGVNAAHPDLKGAICGGKDFTHAGTSLWECDATGNGTACAGVIASADNGTGITGIAPESQIQSLKLYPGGRISDLLKAMDWCLAHGTDVVQVNLSYPNPSWLIALKIRDLHTAGIVAIAPVGDTGGHVTFLAAVPGVLAVTALAHSNSSWVAPRNGQQTAGVLYTPSYAPTVPGADLAAPGTNILTTAGESSYTTVDGTALAAAHITALSALALAHHPGLRNQTRTFTRLHHLHSVLTTSSVPVTASHVTGRGIPDAARVVGMRPLFPQTPPISLQG